MVTFLNNTTAKRDFPIAVKGVCNTCSLGIYAIENGIIDRVKYAYIYDGNIHSSFRKAVIHSTVKGRAYFLINGRREFLDNYIRVEMFGDLYTKIGG